MNNYKLVNYPHLLLLALIVVAAFIFIDTKTWVLLSISGAAMGVLLFLMSAGMTITFGLMNVLNLAHGAFVSLGAFVGAAVLVLVSPSSWFLGLCAALLVAMMAAAFIGMVFEKIVIRPVYNDMLKQILVTVGGSIVLMELLQVLWGSSPISVPRPAVLRGAFLIHEGIPLIGGLALEKYRLVMVLFGLAVYGALIIAIEYTRIGILVRAGVEDRGMVEALGQKMGTIFLLVFIAGCALAGLGGVLWALYQETITNRMGDELLISIIVVIIMGGLGSIRGCFYSALMVGLFNLYIAYLWPVFASVAGVGLMLVILMWRPQGLIPVLKA